MEEKLAREDAFTSSALTRDFLFAKLRDEPREVSCCLYLNTRHLADALALVDVRVFDHFVVGDGDPVSFAECGLL